MHARDLSLWLTVAVALVVGALPLQVCMPHDGEPASVQVAGCHGHEHEHDDGAPTAPRHGDACCDDVPLDRSVPGAAVVVPGLAATAATSWVASLPVAPNGPARAVAHAAPPRERGLVVLLR